MTVSLTGVGTTITTNGIDAVNMVVTGAADFNIGALVAVTNNFDARNVTGDIVVGADAAKTTGTIIRTGSGDDLVILAGGAGGDVTAVLGAGDDTVTVFAAQEHSVGLGDGIDTIEMDALATAMTAGTAISTAVEFLTVTDYVTGVDSFELENAAFTGLTTTGVLAATQYVEGTLASTAATDVQLQAIATAAGIGAGVAYVAAVQIGTSIYLAYDANGSNVAGGVSIFSVLQNADLADIARTDFIVV